MSDQAKVDPRDPLLAAGVDLVGRTGAAECQIRWSDDEQPVVWMAVATYHLDRRGRPVTKPDKRGSTIHHAGGGMTPAQAVIALIDRLVDGALCKHCRRPTGVTEHWESDMPLAEVVCWYVYDPETERYRRSCEGDQ